MFAGPAIYVFRPLQLVIICNVLVKKANTAAATIQHGAALGACRTIDMVA